MLIYDKPLLGGQPSLNGNLPVPLAEMPTFRDLKSGDSLFFTSPLPRKFRTLYQVLHEVDTIQIRDHRFDAGNNLCQ